MFIITGQKASRIGSLVRLETDDAARQKIHDGAALRDECGWDYSRQSPPVDTAE